MQGRKNKGGGENTMERQNENWANFKKKNNERKEMANTNSNNNKNKVV